MTCLPVSKLAAWLFSIHASKVKPELRSAVEMYQREAADVLDRHFRLREERRDAKQAQEPAAPPTDQTAVLAEVADLHARFEAGEVEFDDFVDAKEQLMARLDVR